jgi:hypothetical protein
LYVRYTWPTMLFTSGSVRYFGRRQGCEYGEVLGALAF